MPIAAQAWRPPHRDAAICIAISFVALILSLPCIPKRALACKKDSKKMAEVVPLSATASEAQVKAWGDWTSQACIQVPPMALKLYER